MFIKSRIIFYSGEEIIVSRFRGPRGKGIIGLPPLSFYPEYERIVEGMDDIAYIFIESNPVRANFEDFLDEKRINYSLESVGAYCFYYGFDREFPHTEFTYYLHTIGLTPEEMLRYL